MADAAPVVFGTASQSLQSATAGLPSCFEAHDDGLYLNPAQFPTAEIMMRAVDQLFNAGMVLRDLDYSMLQDALFDRGKLEGQPMRKLASSIEAFPEERKSLYHNVNIEGGKAEYVFEPLMIDREVDGKMVSEAAQLDIDEFLAALWQKKLRFGVDLAAVRTALQTPGVTRVTIASERSVVSSVDGGVEEQTPDLKRSNAPRVLEDGRMDLSQYANRFPQVAAGTALLKKVSPRAGEVGRTLDGAVVRPDAPKDFILSSLAGEGTRIEQRGGVEYLVAEKDGFLNVDSQTNQLSISEKIINRDGVNARTTGNLRLQGDEFEEYGEVQEGRVVEGKHLTFHADVCGRVMSTGGNITLESNLVGGVALNRDGNIVVKGRASGAHLQVVKGTIRVQRAENSVLVGDRIEVESAVGCTLLGDEIVVQHAEGCSIAGKHIEIAVSTARGSEETLVSMLRPDLVAFDTQRVREEMTLKETENLLAELKSGLEVITNTPEFQQFLQTAGKIQRKELVLNEDQENHWHHFKVRIGPVLRRASDARDDIKALEAETLSIRAAIADLLEEQRKLSAVGNCRIDTVSGDTRVRTYVVVLEAPPLTRLQPKELHATLCMPAPGEQVLFSGDKGTFSWDAE